MSIHVVRQVLCYTHNNNTASNMKLVIFVAFVLCGVLVSAIQPGCRTRYEMRMKWSVQNMNGAFWECPAWGTSVRRSCPTGTLFSAPYQTCVPVKYWEEFPYHAPPTTVYDYADECTEDYTVCTNPCKIETDIQCIGGNIVNGQCVCPPNWALKNGVCSAAASVDICRANELWHAAEQQCVCKPGFQMINGQCLSINMDESGRCPGAPDSAYTPGTMDCNALTCTQNQYLNGTLYPTRNPQTFWQCANIGWIEEMPCAPGTCFDYHQQVCVHVVDWVNQCL